MRSIPEPTIGYRDRADPRLDTGRERAAQEHRAIATDRVGVVRIRMGVTPWPGLAGNRQFLFDRFIERLEVAVADWPVGTDAVDGIRGEVGRVQPRCVTGVVDHRPAHSAAGVVRPQRDRVLATDLARLGPVQRMCPTLVGHPVGVGIPERPGIQADDPPACPGEPLREHTAAGARTDHDQIHLVAIGVAAHVRT